MPKETPAMRVANTAARLVYSDSDLNEQGNELYERWSTNADEIRDDALDFWAKDWSAVLGGFRRLENGFKMLNQYRLMEEDPIIEGEEAWIEFFKHNEDWDIMFAGSLSGHAVRVWAYGPFDGQLAFAVARSEEEAFASPTSVA